MKADAETGKAGTGCTQQARHLQENGSGRPIPSVDWAGQVQPVVGLLPMPLASKALVHGSCSQARR
jgi:hypothetical protein